MFTTTFANNKLTVDASKFDSVCNYLNQFGCKYETLRYGSGKCVVWINEAPVRVIDSLNRKFSAPQSDVADILHYVCDDNTDYADNIADAFNVEFPDEVLDNDKQFIEYAIAQILALGVSLKTVEQTIERVVAPGFFGLHTREDGIQEEIDWQEFMSKCPQSRHFGYQAAA